MIKDDVVSAISKETRYSKTVVGCVVDSMLNEIIEALSHGDKVQFYGFGTFELKERAPRSGRNPITNEKVFIPACVIPTFRAGSLMKAAATKSLNKDE